MSTQPKIEIYTRWGCPYCYRAKALFDAKSVTYDEIDITMDTSKRTEMMSRNPPATTVPQIFIDDIAIGGSDDLHALDRAGKLDMMLGR